MRLMGRLGRLPWPPFSWKVFLAQRHRGFRFLIPPGREFVYPKYLGHLSVCVNTRYPIEVEMATGTYDPRTSAIIRRFVGAEDVVMDVGANVGALTLLMATVAPQGKVVAIEPGAVTCSRLRQNLVLNPPLKDTVEVLQIGLADQAGELFWEEDPNVQGNAGLLGATGEAVEVRTLDGVLQDLGIHRLDFLKIDVEGMEYEVLQGALASIQQYRPLIYYETLESFREIRGFDLYGHIYKLLSSLNYQHFCVRSQGEISAVRDLKKITSPNTLAIPQEKIKSIGDGGYRP